MPDIGGWEWVILAVVAVVLFGGAKIADFGKNAGRAIREFKEETAKTGEPGTDLDGAVPQSPEQADPAVVAEPPVPAAADGRPAS